MDSVIHSALDEICCGAANGVHLRNLWPKLSPHFASQGLPLCPNVKQAVWENLLEIPRLKFEACNGGASSSSAADLIKCTVEDCEKMNVKIVAPESMRKSFLGIYEMEAPESSLSDIQRLILERLAVARTNGIAQSELSKELRIAPNNLFYPLKRLETQKLILRQPTVIRKKQSSNREYTNDSVVTTNMLYLYRFGKHLGSQQRLEITKEDKLLMDREGADDSDEEIAKEDVHVKDFLPALKAICEKLEKAQGKVLVVSDIKQDLGYRGTAGHRAWRNICHKLKDARVVEECCTMIKKKEVICLRLLQSFSPSHFEPKLHGHDDIDTEQSKNLLKRGEITELLVELPILRQIYDMVDAAGSKGLTNTEVCKRLGLCSKEYHKRYFKQMISRFGLHLQLESHSRSEVYRVWTAGNFNPESSNMAPVEGETVLKEVNESDPHVGDIISHGDLSQPVQVIGTSTSMENVRDINESENDAAVTAEASSNGTNVDNESSSILLLKCSQHNSDVELSSGVPDEELLQASNSVKKNNLLETHSLAVVTTPPTPSSSRRRSNLRYPRLSMGVTSSQREQYVLKMLQEEKFFIKPDLHRRLENLEKGRHTTMDRKTLLRCLNKLQEEGHCKCIHVSVPGVTNCGRSRTIEVVLHPSFQNVSPELLEQIHDKMRSFETQVRQQSYTRQKKGQSVPVLDNVERIPISVRSDIQSERAEVMRSNGFVLAKMVRTKLLHIFLWDRMRSSPGWAAAALLSSNHSYDTKNPHSTCKLFELELAIRSMPLALFLQVVGSPQKFEDMVEKCRSGLLLCDLPVEEYKALVDTLATGRLSWLVDRLRRLKLIRLVSKGHGEDGPSTTLAHALELKPYIEEPVTIVASAGHVLPDLRPQVRHDFVLSSRKAVDEYWKTLEYCYSAAKSRAALLAFPGTAVHEVFHPRSWASSRVLTAEERVELHKRVAKHNPNERLSFSECEKIAKDLNLTMEQVLRVYSVKRQQRLTRSQRDLNAESQDPQTVKGRHILSSCKRKRSSGRIPSKLVNDSAADGQSSLERVSPIYCADDNADGAEVLNLNEEDKEDHTFIRKRALSKLNVSRQKKFLWTEEADRQLVIEYAKRRAALGAKIHRVDWASIPNLPAPPDTCKRRMAVLNGYMPFRKALMKLCNVLAERYTKYLEKFQDKMLDHGYPKKMISDPALGENNLKLSASMPGEWANFDEDIIKVTLEDVLRYKRMTKLEAAHDTFPDQENSEEDEYEGCDRTKASGQRSSSRQPPVKHMKLTNDGGSACRLMHESVAIANAAELLKLIFLSNSKAPEVPMLLAETLRRYSEHDLFAAFNYLREKKIMIGGSSNSPFVLSQYFMQSISLSKFPTDTGKKAANFVSWLREREKDLMEEGIDVPSDLQCGEIFTLCALVSSGELSIAPCLPNEGVGEAEDNRVSKRKCDDNEPGGGEISKKSKKTIAGDGEMTSRREKGFPGIKLCVHREKVSRLLVIESFKDGDTYPAPLFGGKDQGILIDVNRGSSHSDVADCVREMIDSGRTTHRALDASESPWEAMTSYAEYLTSSCSYEVKSSTLHPNLFKTLYSAIQKSGDNGLSMKDIRKVLNIKDEKMLEVIIEVLEAFGRALKVNAFDSIQVVDSLYRSKYFLTSVHYHAGNFPKGQKRKFEDEHIPRNLDSCRETVAPLENEINMSADEVHRVTILNLPENVSDPSTDIPTKDKIMGHQNSDLASPKINIIENLGLLSIDSQLCRPLLPWMNGDGTINELVYKGLIRRVLGIVMQNPGILEDDIIKQMHNLNPQSCRQLLEILNMDNHVIARKMNQTTSSQPPSILGNLLGDRCRKSKLISRVHYFANPMSTTLL
ncbi:hypothetical protein PHJA_001203200 [Phtheirospermum japonicum]|uniref:B-block binding subunit of TFIIIC domain-containing protein n=1 Tax=Phtheirospermum japonicum TaxID=374723 RepID=A0A830C8L9_9LAMI|nr:hypothetical protein PHJA_001203200 [Phtheirospermum japonicum]